MVICVVANCKSQHGKSATGEKVSFHRFPMAKKMRLDWEKRIGRKNLKYSVQSIKAARLCSLHFTDDCYSVSRKTATSMGHTFVRWKLKDDAFPTLLIEEPFLESVENPKSDESDVILGSKSKQQKLSADEDPSLDVHHNQPMDIERSLNVKDMTHQTNQIGRQGKVAVKSRTCSNSSEESTAFRGNGNLEIEIEKIPSDTEKCTNFDTCSKSECDVSANVLSDIGIHSSMDACSQIDNLAVSDINHADKGSQKTSPGPHQSSGEICAKKTHTSGYVSHIKNHDSQFQESDKSSVLLCEMCGLNFSDEVILNNHLVCCKLSKDSFMDIDVKEITGGLPTDINEKSMQVARVAQVSDIIQINLLDYESLPAYTLFVCACGFTTSSSVELMDHTSVHLLEDSFICIVCKLVLSSYLLLQQHVHERKHFWTIKGKLPTPSPISKLEQASTSIPAPGIISQPVPNPPLMCRSRSTGHDYSSDGKVGAMDLTINGLEHVGAPLKCGLCPFSSSSARDLLNHRKAHISSLVQKSGSEKIETICFNTHLSGSVEDKELLKCDSCGYSTKSAIELLQHKTFHSSEGPFRCSSCSYATKSAIDLLQHKKEQSCLGKHFHNCCRPSSNIKK